MSEHAEQFGDRTHEPTPLRLAKAKQRGQVARSFELTSGAAMAGALLAAAMSAPTMVDNLTKMAGQMLGSAAVDMNAFRLAGAPNLWAALAAAGAVALGAMTAALLCSAAQAGWTFSGESVAFDGQRVSPSAGLARMFSLRTAARSLFWAAKTAAVAAVTYGLIRDSLAELTQLGSAGAAGMAAGAGRLAATLAVRVSLVLLAVGAVDFLYQKWQHRRDLRMTHRELRDDLRQMDGSPLTRHRQRQMQQGLRPAASSETAAAIGEIQ